ncbi:sorting nexin-21 isoform X3 [Anas acuta]|uniref:sorting nexin-21 isoform X3 n=1 Tax=Anas acuta TaxID=28680 RepID=UPI0035C92DBD
MAAAQPWGRVASPAGGQGQRGRGCPGAAGDTAPRDGDPGSGHGGTWGMGALRYLGCEGIRASGCEGTGALWHRGYLGYRGADPRSGQCRERGPGAARGRSGPCRPRRDPGSRRRRSRAGRIPGRAAERPSLGTARRGAGRAAGPRHRHRGHREHREGGGRGRTAPGAGLRAGRGGGGRGRVPPPLRSRPVPGARPGGRGRPGPSRRRRPPAVGMAARILHRLRHALGAEGAREERAHDGGEAEDCPESSELEDDTEGLSTRLSGTLSFASHEDEDGDEDEDEEDGAGEEPGEPPEPTGEAVGAENGGRCRDAEPREWDAAAKPPGSSLLTRQLQELWRKSRSSLAPQRLLFEVTSASVVSERSSKKRLRRNFTAETIAKRSRAFEQFLSHLHSIAEIRRSPEFLEFFFLQDLRAAQRLTCTGMYREALATWANACRLQERLGVCGSGRFLLTLAGLAVCHQELDQLGEAHGCCEQALQLLEAQDSHPLLGPFLQAHVHLAWKVGKDKRRSEARLQGLQEAGLPLQQQPSLKECLIKEPLE